MAINVDLVYKTVLLILNQQQRGYITPDEFNKVGNQVQLNIFEKYMSDLNQQLRIPENDSEYANRVKNINEKIDIFKRIGALHMMHLILTYQQQLLHKLQHNRLQFQRLQTQPQIHNLQ